MSAREFRKKSFEIRQKITSGHHNFHRDASETAFSTLPFFFTIPVQIIGVQFFSRCCINFKQKSIKKYSNNRWICFLSIAFFWTWRSLRNIVFYDNLLIFFAFLCLPKKNRKHDSKNQAALFLPKNTKKYSSGFRFRSQSGVELMWEKPKISKLKSCKIAILHHGGFHLNLTRFWTGGTANYIVKVSLQSYLSINATTRSQSLLFIGRHERRHQCQW